MGEQAALLDDVADAAAQGHQVAAQHVLAEHADLAGIGAHQAVDGLEGGGLARPAGAQQHQHVSRRDRHREAVEGRGRPGVEPFPDAGQRDDGRDRGLGHALLPDGQRTSDFR